MQPREECRYVPTSHVVGVVTQVLRVTSGTVLNIQHCVANGWHTVVGPKSSHGMQSELAGAYPVGQVGFMPGCSHPVRFAEGTKLLLLLKPRHQTGGADPPVHPWYGGQERATPSMRN